MVFSLFLQDRSSRFSFYLYTLYKNTIIFSVIFHAIRSWNLKKFHNNWDKTLNIQIDQISIFMYVCFNLSNAEATLLQSKVDIAIEI